MRGKKSIFSHKITTTTKYCYLQILSFTTSAALKPLEKKKKRWRGEVKWYFFLKNKQTHKYPEP